MLKNRADGRGILSDEKRKGPFVFSVVYGAFLLLLIYVCYLGDLLRVYTEGKLEAIHLFANLIIPFVTGIMYALEIWCYARNFKTRVVPGGLVLRDILNRPVYIPWGDIEKVIWLPPGRDYYCSLKFFLRDGSTRKVMNMFKEEEYLVAILIRSCKPEASQEIRRYARELMLKRREKERQNASRARRG